MVRYQRLFAAAELHGGNTSRTLPNVRKPGRRTTDLSIFKDTYLGRERRLNLQFRAEMFDVFNTPQVTGPEATVDTASFGVISSALAARQIQLAVKLIW